MKRITVRVENEHDEELLKKFLESTDFKDKVETFEEEDELSDEEFRMLEERWERYEKNPSSALSLDDFKKKLKDKYGL
jgi:hypothetical protein